MHMPRYGFSGDGSDMRKLIVFALRAAGEAVDGRGLTRLALLDDNACYFVYADALSGLIENGLIRRSEEMLELSGRGEEVADVTGASLPAALRRAVTAEAAAVRERQMRERCVTAEAAGEDGGARFTGALTDGDRPLLELTLGTGSLKQAQALKKRFEKDAEEIMRKIWELMVLER
jgi:hypothetical protein